ncbi:rhamnulokinase [Bacteroides sp. UBA939]|uniref:rhamnulokinase n=1 Tax=Bacteroides sp. UBA939 TaxID=1946092 RepID=UPI0025BBBCB9|nr:rhamnulokinase family protein [Bacteroides sp. UBA939]
MNTYLAVDFGGGSGRVMAGSICQGALKLEEVYRFPNHQVRMGNHVYWDFLALFEEMKNGLRQAVRKGYHIKSIGIDTWGVDFGLIDRNGNLLGNPVCYRDSRTDGLPEKFFDIETNALSQHYSTVGIQVMAINTLFQLYSMKMRNDVQLEVADRLLFMPDLFSYFLTGVANNEYCIASTSELLDACSRNWNSDLIRRLGVPEHLFGDIIMPGSVRGKLKKEIAEEIGLKEEVDVIAVGSHDTASAVFAVPTAKADRSRCAFLSSGTWSLLGVELDEPILTEEARLSGFTNEGGVGGKIRFLQNITGLWILQRLIAQWKEQGGECAYDVLLPAAEYEEISSVIDVDDKRFQNPADMEVAIADYCREHQLPVPATRGEYVRCVLQSLAQRYKQAIDKLNVLLPAPVEQLNIIGGGCRNALLNKLTENALGIPVVAGPVEATAIGNILVQAIAKGEISSREEIKEYS